MSWKVIKGEGVRNLHPFVVSCDEKWNWFWGDNGAGKTSVLECVSLLGTGRSFRTQQPNKMIRSGGERLVVYGESHDGRYRVGVSRSADGAVEVSVNGERSQRLQGLSDIAAVKVIEPDIMESLEGAAVERRRSLEWLMFHVEHESRDLLSRYKRTLAQRNAWLRHNKGEIAGAGGTPFDLSLGEWGEALGARMEALAAAVLVCFMNFLEEGASTEIRWRSGWKKGLSLAEAMMTSLESDRERGFTQNGPHRLDFDLMVAGRSLRHGDWSRGELKYFSVLWQLACVAVLEGNKDVLVLLDDVFAEVDEIHLMTLLSVLGKLKAQCFLTGVAIPEAIRRTMSGEGKWFHVEHGKITPA